MSVKYLSYCGTSSFLDIFPCKETSEWSLKLGWLVEAYNEWPFWCVYLVQFLLQQDTFKCCTIMDVTLIIWVDSRTFAFAESLISLGRDRLKIGWTCLRVREGLSNAKSNLQLSTAVACRPRLFVHEIYLESVLVVNCQEFLSLIIHLI